MKVRVSHLSLESISICFDPLYEERSIVWGSSSARHVLPRNPTHTTHGLFRLSPPPPHYYYPRANSHFWIRVASRRAASLSLTHACCVSSLAPGHNNSPEIKTNLLLSHLFLFFLSSYLAIIAFLNFLGQAFQRCFFVLTSTANFHIFFPSCYI